MLSNKVDGLVNLSGHMYYLFDFAMKKNIKKITHFLALGFGSGLSPKAPGTAGTLAAVPLYFLMAYLSVEHYIFALLVMGALGIYICDMTARDWGVEDDPRIVWDEMVGYLLTMFLAPPGWLWVGLGFVLFRFFDVLKPWPISVCDRRIKGGLGIMADDVLAGIGAWGVLHLIQALKDSLIK